MVVSQKYGSLTNGKPSAIQIGGVLQYNLEVYSGVALSSIGLVLRSCTGWRFLNSAHLEVPDIVKRAGSSD